MTTLQPDFTIKIERASDGSPTVIVAGEIDLYRVPELAQAMQTAAASGASTISVDLSDVTFLDSTTLALLVQQHRQLAANGCALIVLVGDQTPTTALAITGIDRMLTIDRVNGDNRAAGSSQSTEAAVPTAATPRGDRCRVLVVDDDDRFAELVATTLDADGRFTLLARARDGKQAAELAIALSPDVVLMDIDMPVMDGVEATRQIHQQRPEITILIVSGSDYSARALEARDAGAADYLRKSQVPAQLIDTILALPSATPDAIQRSHGPVETTPTRSAPSAQPTLAVFYSPRSGRCRRTDGHLAQVLQRRRNHQTFRVLRISCDERPDLQHRFSVNALPSLLLIENKHVRARLESPRGPREIQAFLAPWLR